MINMVNFANSNLLTCAIKSTRENLETFSNDLLLWLGTLWAWTHIWKKKFQSGENNCTNSPSKKGREEEDLGMLLPDGDHRYEGMFL